jgi:DNA sulfur modification protein DndB
MREVAARVKKTDEVHKSVKLADWIQRILDMDHAKRIAEYLIKDETRMFSAIVLGVYGGSPEWAELSVADPRNELSEDDEDRMNRTIGVLVLSGNEKLFAIDGQHRVAGIKKAVDEKASLTEEEVAVIILGHDDKSDEGKKRTRRLFVTLNQTAKKVSDRDFVALSEDNGLAVVTRDMIDNFDLFQIKDIVSFSGTVTIRETDKAAVTSILGLFQIIKGLYPRKHTAWPKYTAVQRARPDGKTLKAIYDHMGRYWELLVELVPEYGTVFTRQTRQAAYYRTGTHNHLLFRPAGQLAFARATEYLTTNHSLDMKRAIKLLLRKTRCC